MKTKIILLMLFVLSSMACAQRADSIRFYRRDGTKVYWNGSDSAGVKVANSGKSVRQFTRAATPYPLGDTASYKTEVMSSDGDSVLSGTWHQSDGNIVFKSQGRTIATIGSGAFYLNNGISGNSPKLILQSGSTSDSVYLQWNEVSKRLDFSRPLAPANGFFDVARTLSADGDTLVWRGSSQRIPIYLHGASVNQVIGWTGNGWGPIDQSGGGGGGGTIGDSVFVVKLSNGTAITTDTDTMKFSSTNFTKGTGGSYTINLVQDIAPSSSPSWYDIQATHDMTVGDSLYLMHNATYSIPFVWGNQAVRSIASVATGNVLLSGGTTAAPSFGKVGLTTHVSGTLPIANGGTGITTTPTNGGLVYGNGSTQAYTSAGTSGYFWIANGAAAPSAFNLFGTSNTFTATQNVSITGAGPGVYGYVTGGTGLKGESVNSIGVNGISSSGTGGRFESTTGNALEARTSSTIRFAANKDSVWSTLQFMVQNPIYFRGPGGTITYAREADDGGVQTYPFMVMESYTADWTGASLPNPTQSGAIVRTSDSLLTYLQAQGRKVKIRDEGDSKATYYLRGDSCRVYVAGIRSGDLIAPHWISTNVNGALTYSVVANDTIAFYSTYFGEPDSSQFYFTIERRSR